jgi:transcriptional regulator with XRE-family HTH domain
MRELPQPSGEWLKKDVLQLSMKGLTKAGGAAFAILTLAGLAGTGGISDSNFWRERQSRGGIARYFQGVGGESISASRTSTENLARVRAILKPAVSDLATLFGVSRQTIYNWQMGEQPKPVHMERLEELAKAADIIAMEGLINPGQLLKRKISNGENLLDIVRSGGSASQTAQKLVQIVRREEQQRKLLAVRLAGRKRPLNDYADMGVPLLNEQG